MKKDILKMIAVVLFLESIYMLYKESIVFSYSPLLILYTIGVPLLLVVSSVGLFMKKEWAIVLFWIASAMPMLLSLLVTGFSLESLNTLVAIANIGILIYLSNQKGKLAK